MVSREAAAVSISIDSESLVEIHNEVTSQEKKKESVLKYDQILVSKLQLISDNFQALKEHFDLPEDKSESESQP